MISICLAAWSKYNNKKKSINWQYTSFTLSFIDMIVYARWIKRMRDTITSSSSSSMEYAKHEFSVQTKYNNTLFPSSLLVLLLILSINLFTFPILSLSLFLVVVRYLCHALRWHFSSSIHTHSLCMYVFCSSGIVQVCHHQLRFFFIDVMLEIEGIVFVSVHFYSVQLSFIVKLNEIQLMNE